MEDLMEELSCSICLELFKDPVTIPCGHNFCGSCLDESWTFDDPPYRCPQCRAEYPTRPQLQKNTVLCALVSQLQPDKAEEALPDGWTPPSRAENPGAARQVPCDHCLTATAVKTCLVCMASFCQEHLRPHLDSPAFSDHPLQPPVFDLKGRKCPQHNRLRELFCLEHDECICHICLVEHKTCSPVPLSQASAELEAKMKKKVALMHSQLNGASKALEDVRAKQQSILEAADRKAEQISQEYMEMKDLIMASETNSIQKIKEEGKRVSAKFDHIYQILLKKKSEIQNLKEEIELALTKGDEFEFLKKAAKLQGVTTKPVYVPKVELNHELIKGILQRSTELKNGLKHCLIKCQDKPKESTCSGDPGEQRPTTSHKPSYPTKKMSKEEKKLNKPPFIPIPGPPFIAAAATSPNKGLVFTRSDQSTNLKQESAAAAKAAPSTSNTAAVRAKVLEAFLGKSRAELLAYYEKVILDYNTAHNKVVLSGNYSEASVADTPQSYRPHPQRFTTCSQVLGLHCYKKGIHYWEVELQKNSFCGVGICYGSMDRNGLESRLGRNSASWCVEWFNNKISTWHNSVEKTLPSTKTSRVGVLLNCDHGFVIFFGTSDKLHVLYKYKVDFTEALYPAFWVYSVGTMLSICNSK